MVRPKLSNCYLTLGNIKKCPSCEPLAKKTLKSNPAINCSEFCSTMLRIRGPSVPTISQQFFNATISNGFHELPKMGQQCVLLVQLLSYRGSYNKYIAWILFFFKYNSIWMNWITYKLIFQIFNQCTIK